MPLNINGNIISSTDITDIGVFKSKVNRDGLVCYLDAGDKDSYVGSGTSWVDLSGVGNNGTLTNGPTFDSGNGGSIVLDGSDDYIIAGNSGMNHRTGNFTYCAWINQTVLQDYDTLFENGLYTAGILIRPSTFSSGVEIYSQGSTPGTFPYVPSINTWYYLSFVRFGNDFKFFVNGVYSSTMTFTADVQPSTSYLYIGASQHAPTQVFYGKIAMIQVYDRGLNPFEVAENFQATRGRFGI